MGKRKHAKHKYLESKELNDLVHSSFKKHAAKVVDKAHGKKALPYAVETQVIAFVNKADHARVIIERTKENATVPEDFDLDFTVRVVYTDLGIVLSATQTLEHGIFLDMYARHNGFHSIPADITDAAVDRVVSVLKGAKVTEYKKEEEEPEQRLADEDIPAVEVIDDGPGPDDIVDLVSEEEGEE